MKKRPIEMSRREFVLAATTTLLSAEAALAQAGQPTARQATERIRAAVGVPWRDATVDGFKAGNPDTPVTGLAVTTIATLDVLRRAAASGRNLIVTQEPTFYTAADDPGARAADPVCLAKRDFIDRNRMVVWRFSDHWRARPQAEMVVALSDALGGAPYRAASDPAFHDLGDGVSLGEIVGLARERLPVRGGMRVIGDPATTVRTVVVVPGLLDRATALRELRRADLVIAGEAREWEGVEYAFDSVSAGQRGSLITLGRVLSEEPGARACAVWLRTHLPEIPIDFFTVGDPYWRPA